MGEFARELRKSELERLLPYVTEILRLQEEADSLMEKEGEIDEKISKYERQEQDQENDSVFCMEDRKRTQDFLNELHQQYEEVKNKRKLTGEKLDELQIFISKLLEYIFDNSIELKLRNNEIKMKSAKEYFYFIEADGIKWEKLFADPSDFIVTACITLGETERQFLKDMLKNFRNR